MTIQSMTGYGRSEITNDTYQLTVEIKSVNNRYRDFRFKIGSILLREELTLRKKLEEYFKRGSFEIYVQYKKLATQSSLNDLDQNKVAEYIQFIKSISTKEGVELSVKATEFLRSEFQKDQDDKKFEELSSLLERSFPQAIIALESSRKEEGAKLLKVIEGHLSDYENCLELVKGNSSKYEEFIKEKLMNKINEFDNNLVADKPRYLQEVIYYMEKLDINEEISRIKIHLEKLGKLIRSKGECGRQLDFLLQELNRETNTIGSKSGNEEISSTVVQMKVHLEKIREQALNIE